MIDFFLGESDDDEEESDTETQIAGVIDDDFKDITGKNIANDMVVTIRKSSNIFVKPRDTVKPGTPLFEIQS